MNLPTLNLPIDLPIRRLYRSLISLGRQMGDRTQLSRSAIVFAPHPDDETLGCGGTILQKKAASASVKIVLMTDGSRSHGLMAPAQLKALRAQEVLAAAERLGVPAVDVLSLGFEDSTLAQNQGAAVQQVKQILYKVFPEEVYVPYGRDGVPDHDATQRIVTTAVRQTGIATTVCEYPVWFWHHWPWISASAGAAEAVPRRWQPGLTLLREFRWAVDIRSVGDRKREALAQHRSQMTRLQPDPNWSILPEVA
ncbi:LmbE-like protein, partial [filamentous cyanobacterium CCP5]